MANERHVRVACSVPMGVDEAFPLQPTLVSAHHLRKKAVVGRNDRHDAIGVGAFEQAGTGVTAQSEATAGMRLPRASGANAGTVNVALGHRRWRYSPCHVEASAPAEVERALWGQVTNSPPCNVKLLPGDLVERALGGGATPKLAKSEVFFRPPSTHYTRFAIFNRFRRGLFVGAFFGPNASALSIYLIHVNKSSATDSFLQVQGGPLADNAQWGLVPLGAGDIVAFMQTNTPPTYGHWVDVLALVPILGLSERKIRQLAIDGLIPSMKVHGSRRYDPQAVIDRLKETFGEGGA